MKWISVNDRLPEEGKYVLAIAPDRPWYDRHDQDHVRMVIVRLEKGMTTEEIKRYCGLDVPFKKRRGIGRSDQHGNNAEPYSWQAFGPCSFNGQEVTHWQPLPEPPEEAK